MAKIICLNLSKNIYTIEDNKILADKTYVFDKIYNDFNDIQSEILKLKNNSCVVLCGHSKINFLYKPNGVLENILNKMENTFIEGLEFRYDGVYDIFTSLPINSFFVRNRVYNLSEKDKMKNTLEHIELQRIINQKIIKLMKSHLLLKIYNSKKIIYILDLSLDQKNLLDNTVDTIYSSFISKTVKNIKNNIFSNDNSDTTCKLLQCMKLIKPTFTCIGLLDNSIKTNLDVFNFFDKNTFELPEIKKSAVIEYLKIKPSLLKSPPPSPLNKPIPQLPFFKPLPPLGPPPKIIDSIFIPPVISTKIDTPRPNDKIDIIQTIKPTIMDELPTYKFFENIPRYNLELFDIPKKRDFILDEDLKIKLEVYFKVMHTELVKNYIRMNDYTKENMGTINNEVKNSLLSLCEVIVKDLTKY